MQTNISLSKKVCDFLYYEVGKQNTNFRVTCILTNPEGDRISFPWRPYLDAQADEKFMSKINNREILKNEIVIDLDLETNETLEELKLRYEKTCERLKKDGYSFRSYFSGSKGYHIHLIFNQFLSLSLSVRKKIRAHLISKYGGDLMKVSEKSMIALEDVPHWKTGKLKTLLEVHNE